MLPVFRCTEVSECITTLCAVQLQYWTASSPAGRHRLRAEYCHRELMKSAPRGNAPIRQGIYALAESQEHVGRPSDRHMSSVMNVVSAPLYCIHVARFFLVELIGFCVRKTALTSGSSSFSNAVSGNEELP
jgi:hypothetical protein